MSINKRENKNGKIVYTAQVRVTRNGVPYSESATFSDKQKAKAWEKRKQAELKKADDKDLLRLKKMHKDTLTGVLIIEGFIGGHKNLRKTALSTYHTLLRFDFAQQDWTQLTAQNFIRFAEALLEGEKPAPVDPANPTDRDLTKTRRSPATVGNYFSFLRTLMKHGGTPFNVRLPHAELDLARDFLLHRGTIARSKQRNRRPSRNELELLLSFFLAAYKENPRRVPMHLVIMNQITGCNRRGETARGTWSHYDVESGRMLIEDMKHPRKKDGNDVYVRILDEQRRTIEAMPRTQDRIFPYHPDTLTRLFTDACKLLGIVDLHFHDLRHEGISRLFECGLPIPQVADVSGHMDWPSLKRYTHLRNVGDPYEGWEWIERLYAGEFDIK